MFPDEAACWVQGAQKADHLVHGRAGPNPWDQLREGRHLWGWGLVLPLQRKYYISQTADLSGWTIFWEDYFSFKLKPGRESWLADVWWLDVLFSSEFNTFWLNWCSCMFCCSCSWRNVRQRMRRCVRVTERRSSSCGTDCRCLRRRERPSTNTWSHPGRGTWKRWEDSSVPCAPDFSFFSVSHGQFRLSVLSVV